MSLLELLSKPREDQKPEQTAPEPKKTESAAPKLVPRSLRAKQTAPPSQPKFVKSTASASSSSLKPGENTHVPSTNTVDSSDMVLTKPADSISDDLVALRTMSNLYDPSVPNNYYETVFKLRETRMDVEVPQTDVKEMKESKELKPVLPASGGIIPSSMFGEKMLYKQGWKGNGFGLGREGQGMATPLVGFETPAEGSMKSVGAIAAAPVQLGSSRVILIRHMVLRGKADAALADETALECNIFGTVLQCIMQEESDPLACRDEEAVRLFVQFDSVAAAERAKKDLSTRRFDGRAVLVTSYPEAAFMEKKYWLPPRSAPGAV